MAFCKRKKISRLKDYNKRFRYSDQLSLYRKYIKDKITLSSIILICDGYYYSILKDYCHKHHETLNRY